MNSGIIGYVITINILSRLEMRIDPQKLEKAKEILIEALKSGGYSSEYIQKQIQYLFDLNGGFADRFNYAAKFVKREQKEFLLVSGSAIGLELLKAFDYGFKKVAGTEIDKYYIDASEVILSGTNAKAYLYDGEHLPFKDNEFSAIYSGHIIEHTKDPQDYLSEHLRVLKRGGVFFLEFPDRYNDIELHTGTRSFEWLPRSLRNCITRALSLNPLFSKRRRLLYQSIRETLQQVSVKDIMKWIGNIGQEVEIVDHSTPIKGFTRLIIEKK